MKETANRHRHNQPTPMSTADKRALRGAWKHEQRAFFSWQRLGLAAASLIAVAYLLGSM